MHKRQKHKGRRSVYNNWKAVTIEEMKAFIGMILNMGIIQLERIRDYWSTCATCNIPFFRQIMSRDRFLQIFGMLHVGEIDAIPRQSKIQPFVNLLLPIIKSNYIPDKQVAVDEAIITFRGRVSFRQYIKGKPNPWGIKAYVLSDSKSGYMHNLLIYYGKDTCLIERPDLSHTCKVVLTLCDYLKNKQYDLYTDRFYTSIPLADELDRIGFTVTGTIIANKKGLPKALKEKTKLKKGTVKAYRSGKKMVLSWTDKRKIIMLSTKHSNGTSDVKSRR